LDFYSQELVLGRVTRRSGWVGFNKLTFSVDQVWVVSNYSLSVLARVVSRNLKFGGIDKCLGGGVCRLSTGGVFTP